MLLQKGAADGARRRIIRREFDALLAGEGDRVTLHGGGWRTASPRTRARAAPAQGRGAAMVAISEFADDALGDVADRIDGADHFLLAKNDIIEEALKLRRQAGIDQSRVSLLEHAEELQSGIRGHDVLSLRHQEILSLEPPDDVRPGGGRANALGLLQPVAQTLVVHKAPGVLHRLDQRALVVSRRRTGFLVFDLGILQLGGLAVCHNR